MLFNYLTFFFSLTVTDDKRIHAEFSIYKLQELQILSLELILEYQMKRIRAPFLLPLFRVAEEPVGDIIQRVRLAVLVSQLLHLQGSFLGRALTQTLSKHEHMLFVFELRGAGLGEGRDVLNYVFHFGGELGELSPQLDALRLRVLVVVPRGEPDSKHGESDNLV